MSIKNLVPRASYEVKLDERIGEVLAKSVELIIYGDGGIGVVPKVHAPPQSPPRALRASSAEREYLSVREVAELLQLTNAGIYAMVAARRIPHIKLSNRVRFARADVVAWLQQNRVPSLENK